MAIESGRWIIQSALSILVHEHNRNIIRQTFILKNDIRLKQGKPKQNKIFLYRKWKI